MSVMNAAPAARAARRVLLPIALMVAACASQAQSNGSEAAPSPAHLAAQARWRAELSAFDAADRQQWPSEGGVVFVGSSTIRFWTRLAQDFPQLPVVINRGFGGSTMADCSFFARELVLRYKPRHVLVYAGDNDLAEGRTPIEVLESFAQFANSVRAELPDARISYISIKPSPSREKLLPRMRETNDIVAAYLRRLPNSDYIDVFTPMLGGDGRPRAELFLRDQLHLNDEGYRLWRSVIGAQLARPADRAELSIAPASR
ncbi:Argininosuccinate lyase [Variovorax sp. PBL-H6]|nr:Argininosuccinate lyase [Variovorax sp. PBL-H6]